MSWKEKGLIEKKSIDNDKEKKIILTSKGKEYVNTCKKLCQK